MGLSYTLFGKGGVCHIPFKGAVRYFSPPTPWILCVRGFYLSTMETSDQKLISGKVEASASFSSTSGYGNVGWSHEEERAVVRKFDWRILPGLSVLYFLCFLDRA